MTITRTRIIGGSKYMARVTACRLADALPDARLQLINGAGHHLPRRAPAVVADVIMAFLAAAQLTAVPITRGAMT